MSFFDLNIPYHDNTESSKHTILKTLIKTLELGYTGIAYNLSVKSLLSDKHICSIPRFSISSLLKLSPNLSNSVKFHRELLGVRDSIPFRQFTRLTMVVDSVVQCSGLSSGKSVLRSYDLVAVRPGNQAVFELVCKTAEVDLISIDFTARVPFEIKHSSLQCAIERGIYFEITYSPLILDIELRKQMIHNTKLLVQWTHGKNLIFSSAAESVSEIRGPCDVANLSSMLGISMEHAKAAISKNCRSLLLNAARKKQNYKNAIKVDKSSFTEPLVSKEAWYSDGSIWDHISDGEGDMLLDDIAKSFAASSKVPKTSKTVNSVACSDGVRSYGMQLKDWLPGSGDKGHPPPNLSAHKGFRGSSETVGIFDPLNKLVVDSIEGGVSSATTPLKHQTAACLEFSKSLSGNAIPEVSMDGKESEALASCFKEGKGLDGAVSAAVEMISLGKMSEVCGVECATVAPLEDVQASEQHADARGSSDFDTISSILVDVSPIENNLLSIPLEETAPSSSYIGDDTSTNGLDPELDACDVRMLGVLSEEEESQKTKETLAVCDMSINIDNSSIEKHGLCKEITVSHTDTKMPGESLPEMQADEDSHTEFVPPEAISVEPDDRKQFKSGKSRCMHRRIPPRAFQFSLKRQLYSMVLKKKKSCKLKNKKSKV